MSLDFNLKEVKLGKDGKSVTRDKDGNLTPLAQTMVFMTMFVDLGEINAKNYKTFWERCYLYEHALGAMRKAPDGQDKFLTLLEVQMFIGLTTNVANKTDKAFRSRLGQLVVQRLEEKMRRITLARN